MNDVCVRRYLHVWEAESGAHISSIMIHSVYKFPFAVSRTRNLVATGSNIHTAIKVRFRCCASSRGVATQASPRELGA